MMKVADLTVTEFRKLVSEIVEKKLDERLGKPSIAIVPGKGSKTRKSPAAQQVTLEQVCREFGILLKE